MVCRRIQWTGLRYPRRRSDVYERELQTMNPPTTTSLELVRMTIDGRPIFVPAGTSVFDAARLNGIFIPTLCHLQNEIPVGVCRLCVVDTGARVLTASCVRPVEPGMKVDTKSGKVLDVRKTLLELLMADHPSPCARQEKSGDCELETLAKAAGAVQPRFGRRTVGRGLGRW